MVIQQPHAATPPMCVISWASQHIPDSKVHEANTGPSGADRTQVGPCWPHELCYLGCCIYPTIHRFHIPQSIILHQQCAHVCTLLLVNGALWGICLTCCGIYETALFTERSDHQILGSFEDARLGVKSQHCFESWKVPPWRSRNPTIPLRNRYFADLIWMTLRIDSVYANFIISGIICKPLGCDLIY